MASITSLPASPSTGTERYLPSGSARITTSASATASAAVVAVAPGLSTSTIRAMRDTGPEPAISTRYPAATASRARTVPTLPAPRIAIVVFPGVASACSGIGPLQRKQLLHPRCNFVSEQLDGARPGRARQVHDVVFQV